MFERVGKEEHFGQEKKAYDTRGRISRSAHPYTRWIILKTVWLIMDKMKKLLMMDSRTFNRLTTPKDKVLTSIEGEMSTILNDERIPEDVRAKLYASAQSRYLKTEHPQWGETSTTKALNPPNAVLNNEPQNSARRGKPLSSILKNSKRVSVNDKNELPIDSEDVPGLKKPDCGHQTIF